MKKKSLFVVTFIVVIISLSFSAEDLALEYLSNALISYNSNQFEQTKIYLDKTLEYSKKNPEIYYLRNKLLNNDRKNNYLKGSNAQKIVEYLDNAILLDTFELMKESKNSFSKVFEYQMALNLYKKMFSYIDKDVSDEYIECLQMLSVSGIQSEIPSIIDSARNKSDSMDLNFYELLYKIKHTKISEPDFTKELNRLYANNYDETKLIFLESFYGIKIKDIIDKYKKISEDKLKTSIYKIDILFNMLKKVNGLNKDQILYLLTNLIKYNGNEDIRIIELLKDKTIADLLKNDKVLFDLINNFTGVRIINSNYDSYWEEKNQYTAGKLVERTLDKNQDGIPDFDITFNEFGKPIKYILFQSLNNFEIFYFNNLDSSLTKCEIFVNDVAVKRINFIKSSLYSSYTDIKYITDSSLSFYKDKIDTIEILSPVRKLTKYNKGLFVTESVDRDGDGILETKNSYHNGVITESIRDTDNDGIFEVKENYQNGKLYTVLIKTKPDLLKYDYKEIINGSTIEKYWDDNNDGIFELKNIEYLNGTSIKYYDINFDGLYDYYLVVPDDKNPDKNEKLYQIINGKWVLYKTISIKNKKKVKDWIIISYKDINSTKIPESIIINDKKNVSGVFIYKGKKMFFEKGIIKSTDFIYRLLVIDNVINLIEE